MRLITQQVRSSLIGYGSACAAMLVPAALLELKDQYAVIKAQVPTAIPLLIANILILYVAGFHL